ncbi:MAG: hypothetical protein R3E39_18320 [Anaerolineae bacterium]
MGQNETRLWSTVAIWIAVAAIGVAAMVTHIDVDGGALVVLFIGLMIGGAAATSTIWKGAEESHHGVDNSEK